MGIFDWLMQKGEHAKTFEQELEDLIIRWMDKSRLSGATVMTRHDIAHALYFKADQLIKRKET